jgi:hypothetical protein
MLCCAGLIGGVYVGQYLGGSWTLIAPATGFGIGLVGDIKFMHKMHHRPSNKDAEEVAQTPLLGSSGNDLPLKNRLK